MQEFASDLIGKPLLSRSGERIGYIKNIQTDKKRSRIRNLECCDEEEEEFVLPVSAVAQFGADAAIVKTLSAVGCKNCEPAPFGLPAYSEKGEKLGTIDDFAREGMQITAIVLSGGASVPVERLVSAADTALFDLSDSGPVKRPPRKPRPKSEKKPDAKGDNAQPAFAPPPLSEEIAVTVAAAAPEYASAQTAGETPALPAAGKKRAGSGLLTGKILPENLFDARGMVIAPAGAVVTSDVIKRALAHNKLFALTLLCSGR